MIIFLSVLVGLAFGSFANVCIFRMPLDRSIRTPSSHCPHCKRSLKPVHNIPVVSFLVLRGRCAYCSTRISWQYPLIEAAMAALFLFHAIYFKQDVHTLLIADFLAFALVTLSVIDYRHRIIPDEISLSMVGVGLAVSFANPYLDGGPGARFIQSLAAGLGGGLMMLGMAWSGEKIFKKEALGGGDIKLMAGVGALLGWQGVAGCLLLGSLAGGLLAATLLVLKKKKLGETLPFGPFLSMGAYAVCLFPGFLPSLFHIDFKALNFP